MAALNDMFGRTKDDAVDDPWWRYAVLQGQRADEWLDALRALVPPKDTQ